MRVARVIVGAAFLLLATLGVFGTIGMSLIILTRWVKDPKLYIASEVLPILASFAAVAVAYGALGALGVGVLRQRRWAHGCTAILSLCMLPVFPIGVLPGLFGLLFAMAALAESRDGGTPPPELPGG